MFKKLAMLFLIAGLVASPSVYAKSVFLNGVDITSLRNQTFKKATVHIDQNGNVHITADGYKVEVVDQDSPEAAVPSASATDATAVDKGGPNSSLSKRYYLVSQPSKNGLAQYDFSIQVNGVERKIVKAGSSQVIMEISAWLHKGENEIVITARKDLVNGRRSTSVGDEAKILVGRGHEENKIVKIDAVSMSVKVNASQTTTIKKHHVIIAN